MSENSKLVKTLKMLIFLSSGLRYSINEIAERFEITERSVYRYLHDLREVGFIIPKPLDGRYFIDKQSPYFKEISELLHFSEEEAHILQRAIHSISDENLLKRNLIRKLYSIYDFERVAETIVKTKQSVIIHEIMKGIKYKCRVLLKGYQSANSSQLRDRIVEPFDFTTNYIATWAYDLEDDSCKTFKNTRISSAQLLAEPWQHSDKHIKLPMDVFRISAEKQIKIKLELSLRAAELLQEEYPLSEKYISKISDSSYFFEGKVSGFKGVGRFILGLGDEIRIISPKSLKDYIRKKASMILNDRS